VPVAQALVDGATELAIDPLALALSGGEDYELLATMAPEAVAAARAELREVFGVALTDVGSIEETSGIVGVDASGTTAPLAPAGWDHFRTR
jgi:thiamine-monophosphate kinase